MDKPDPNPTDSVVTADMVASNVPLNQRVAPDPDRIGIIDELYDFADRLRAGSKGKSNV